MSLSEQCWIVFYLDLVITLSNTHRQPNKMYSVQGVKVTWKDYVHFWWPGDIFEGLINTLSCHLNHSLFLLPP